jgi:hypothetical protein
MPIASPARYAEMLDAARAGGFADPVMVDGAVARRRAFDPRTCNGKGQAAMAARVARACRELGSAGRSAP